MAKVGPEIKVLKKLNEELYKKIGQQNIELEFLKKSTGSSRTCKERACGEVTSILRGLRYAFRGLSSDANGSSIIKVIPL